MASNFSFGNNQGNSFAPSSAGNIDQAAENLYKATKGFGKNKY